MLKVGIIYLGEFELNVGRIQEKYKRFLKKLALKLIFNDIIEMKILEILKACFVIISSSYRF